MIYDCQARGCGEKATKLSLCWCQRHRKLLSAAARDLVVETEIAQRGSREWKMAVQKAQKKILEVDEDAARQAEMPFPPHEGSA